MYKKATSSKYQAERIGSLIDTCALIINKHKYSDEDIRTITFKNIQIIAFSSLGITNLLDCWRTRDEWAQIIPQLLGMIEITVDLVRFMGDALAKTTKLSLVLLCQFQIENFISQVANAIGAQSNKRGFYNKAKNLISFLNLDISLVNELNVPALIRNSLHSEGVYYSSHNKYHSIKLQDVDYEFIDGKVLSCGSMLHIAHALENSVKVLDKILDHKEVRKYKNVK